MPFNTKQDPLPQQDKARETPRWQLSPKQKASIDSPTAQRPAEGTNPASSSPHVTTNPACLETGRAGDPACPGTRGPPRPSRGREHKRAKNPHPQQDKVAKVPHYTKTAPSLTRRGTQPCHDTETQPPGGKLPHDETQPSKAAQPTRDDKQCKTITHTTPRPPSMPTTNPR